MRISSWKDFKDRSVFLLGSGVENSSLIPHLLRAGAIITIVEHDTKTADDKRQIFPKIDVISEKDVKNILKEGDIIFRSPGFPVKKVEQLIANLKQKPLVTSVTDLFLTLTKSKIIGVTGTKGKGTVATILGEILKAAGKDVVVGGNIGRPIFDYFTDLNSNSYVVLELSSFQLEDINHSPHLAVILPITEDHLQPLSAVSPNFHDSINDYVAAKATIILHQTASDSVVYAADNDFSVSLATSAKSEKISVSQHTELADLYVNTEGDVFERGKKLMSLSDLGLNGRHVFLNATLAIAAGLKLGAKVEECMTGIANFRPLPHRLEPFLVRDEITYVDDSYATSPDAAQAAIETFKQPIVWIAGGSSKGATFDQLARTVANSDVKIAILIGVEKERIEDSLVHEAPKVKIKKFSTFAAAVTYAQKLAEPGDVVLLSPACASKDMFKSAADRGDIFKKLINA